MLRAIFILLTLYCVYANGDTLGVAVTGSTNLALDGWKLVQGQNVVATHNGTARRIWIYTPPGTPATNRIKLGVYTNYIYTATLIAQDTLVNATAGQWNSVAVNFPVVQGNRYCVAAVCNGTHGINFESTTATWSYVEGAQTDPSRWPNEMISPLPAMYVSNGARLSMYLETENEGSGGGPGYMTANFTMSFSGSSVLSSPGLMTANFAMTFSADATLTAVGGNNSAKIYCIGDSNTEGNFTNSNQSYRYALQILLGGATVYDFVGPNNNGNYNPTLFDEDNAGVSGQRVHDMWLRIGSELRTYMTNLAYPSYALLMAGTNDCYFQTDTSQYNAVIDEYESMIDTIHVFNPNITIVCATIVPAQTEATDLRIDCYNTKLRAMLTEKMQTVTNLRIAEVNQRMKSNVNWSSEWMYNDLHPNAAGHQGAVAPAFYAAITGSCAGCMTAHFNMSFSGNATFSGAAMTVDSLRPDPWYYGRVFTIYGHNLSALTTISLGNTSLGAWQPISNTMVNDTIPVNMQRGRYPVYLNNIALCSLTVFRPRYGW